MIAPEGTRRIVFLSLAVVAETEAFQTLVEHYRCEVSINGIGLRVTPLKTLLIPELKAQGDLLAAAFVMRLDVPCRAGDEFKARLLRPLHGLVDVGDKRYRVDADFVFDGDWPIRGEEPVAKAGALI